MQRAWTHILRGIRLTAFVKFLHHSVSPSGVLLGPDEGDPEPGRDHLLPKQTRTKKCGDGAQALTASLTLKGVLAEAFGQVRGSCAPPTTVHGATGTSCETHTPLSCWNAACPRGGDVFPRATIGNANKGYPSPPPACSWLRAHVSCHRTHRSMKGCHHTLWGGD